MGIEPQFVQREARPYAGIREQAMRDGLPEIVPPTLSALQAFLRKHRISAAGPLLIRYFVVDYDTDRVEIDMGIPVEAATLPADERVRADVIPAGTFATVVHLGPYDALVKTTAALLDWGKEKKLKWRVAEEGNLTRWSARVEHYLVGPPEEANPKSWRTEIAILVAGDQA